MSKHTLTILALSPFLPAVAFAAGGVLGIIDILLSFVDALVPILIGCAVVVFFWGIVKFVAHAGDENAVTEGKQFMIWGMVGLFVIIALWSIVGYVQESIGVDLGGGDMSAPSLPIGN